MKLKEILHNDYFRLFVRREGKVVIGRNFSRLWLLCGVLSVTFLAIAFSNASLNYLSYKMNDPFINWVDIKNNFAENDFSGFELALQDDSLLTHFNARDFQTDKYWYTLFATSGKNGRNLKCRFFADIQTDLVKAVLGKDNVVYGARIADEKIDNSSYGVIITMDALVNKLGYTKDVPTYLYYKAYCDPEAAEEFGVEVIDDHFALVPVPVLGVVKRLPTNMDIIGTKFFYHQDNGQALNMYEASYASSFIYFVPESLNAEKFKKTLEEKVGEHTDMAYYSFEDYELPRMASFREGKFVALFFDDENDVDYEENAAINDEILSLYGAQGAVRVYDYYEANYSDDDDDYISVHFNDLNHIGEFQEYAKNNYKIEIDMSQINAKENFNAVSLMANVLSWTMIVFAIVCIILFIVNLLQSYFQKVKRNLGTFKAFGISNHDLIVIYVLIMTATIVAAVVISLGVSWLIQGILPLLGILKDGTFNYLALWNMKTVYSVIIIILASIATVYVVMRGLLKATPGDLIYDR